MRRVSDSFINATQVLRSAGLDKTVRTKILERDFVPGVHEKIQGGYHTYQGTWIPLPSAIILARDHKVYDELAELLEFDMPQDHAAFDPVKQRLQKHKRPPQPKKPIVKRSSEPPDGDDGTPAPSAQLAGEKSARKRARIGSAAPSESQDAASATVPSPAPMNSTASQQRRARPGSRSSPSPSHSPALPNRPPIKRPKPAKPASKGGVSADAAALAASLASLAATAEPRGRAGGLARDPSRAAAQAQAATQSRRKPRTPPGSAPELCRYECDAFSYPYPWDPYNMRMAPGADVTDRDLYKVSDYGSGSDDEG
ncbi:transcriptional regulator swi6 [Irineochytrium annulatum]|nr:transcriptional regulator swi6 [Irineochytrium annulatum]